MTRAVYTRIPLSVEAIFSLDGQMKPVCLFFEEKRYTVDRILQIRPYKPPHVACIAPLSYRVVIEGVEKEIFYEADSNTWFSVKIQYL